LTPNATSTTGENHLFNRIAQKPSYERLSSQPKDNGLKPNDVQFKHRTDFVADDEEKLKHRALSGAVHRDPFYQTQTGGGLSSLSKQENLMTSLEAFSSKYTRDTN